MSTNEDLEKEAKIDADFADGEHRVNTDTQKNDGPLPEKELERQNETSTQQPSQNNKILIGDASHKKGTPLEETVGRQTDTAPWNKVSREVVGTSKGPENPQSGTPPKTSIGEQTDVIPLTRQNDTPTSAENIRLQSGTLPEEPDTRHNDGTPVEEARSEQSDIEATLEESRRQNGIPPQEPDQRKYGTFLEEPVIAFNDGTPSEEERREIGTPPEQLRPDRQGNGITPQGSRGQSVRTPRGGSVRRQNDGTPFEEAVRLTGYGWFHHWLLLVAGLCAMSPIMEIVVVGYLIPSAQCDFNMTDKDKGVLGAITETGIFCSSLLWGIISDLRGRKKVMQITLLVDAVIAVISSLSPAFWLLVLLRFTNGFCISAAVFLAYTYLGEFNTTQNRNRNLLLIGVFTGSCALVIPALGWAILPQPLWAIDSPWGVLRSWRLLIILAAVPSLLSGLSLFTLPESPKFLLASGKSDEALKILSKMYVCNTGNSEGAYQVLALKKEDDTPGYSTGGKKSFSSVMNIIWNQTAPLLQRPLLKNTLLVCIIQYGNIASASGLLMWLPELFNLQARFSEANSGRSETFCYAAQHQNETSLSIFVDDQQECNSEIKEQVFINSLILGSVNMLLPLFGGFTVNLLGKKNLLVFSMVTTGIAAIALNFAPSYPATIALSSIVVSVTGMCISHVSSIAVDLFPTHLRAVAVSLSLMCGRLGSITGSFIFGALLKTQCEVAFYFFGGILLLNAVCASLLPKKGRYAI